MDELPPGVSDEDFLYGDDDAPRFDVGTAQDGDGYGEDHEIPEEQQNGHAEVKFELKEEEQEMEENGEETSADDGEEQKAGADDEEVEGEDEEDSESDDDEFVVNVGEIKRPEPKAQGPQGKVDMDGTPTINGQPIYDLDLATMEDRPWRKPGADINDYFNYGFNEETWNMYCERQRKLRLEFNNNQAAVNKSLFSSISLINPALTMTSTGRQLVNICGAENPHNNHKVVVDLTKPPPGVSSSPMDVKPIMRTDLTNSASRNMPPGDTAKPISVVDFTKPPPMMTNLVTPSNVSSSQDGPPGVEDSSAPGTEPTTPSVPPGVPPMDMSMPPPGFNPSMPPPPIRLGGPPPTHMPPPGFGGMPPNHAMAGFSNPPPRFNRPPPLRDFHPPGYGPPPGMDGFEHREQRDYRDRSYSGESDDDEHRRGRKHRRRSRSHSPSAKRRREDKDRDRERDRDRGERERDRGEQDRDRERERERSERGDRDRDRERRRRGRDEEDRDSRSSRRRDRERDDKDREKDRRHRDSDTESARKERRRREGSGERESRRERAKE
ncbi:hypothetical protein QR680_014390 [Steinernema hermaphroditum]|uniref:Pre-mRNA polyadenylation factor Fip1 domain-containing protein n=1 Tax=Steinernema hermaphroditum TaxID=289476 RepID=A0AA39IAB2_9BILA|nr:hypothetical protein QR680_014390 [Steinernema hermaphroditum]